MQAAKGENSHVNIYNRRENNITAHVARPAGADESQSFSTAKELAKLTRGMAGVPPGGHLGSKCGEIIESSKNAAEERSYRIANWPAAPHRFRQRRVRFRLERRSYFVWLFGHGSAAFDEKPTVTGPVFQETIAPRAFHHALIQLLRERRLHILCSTAAVGR